MVRGIKIKQILKEMDDRLDRLNGEILVIKNELVWIKRLIFIILAAILSVAARVFI